jgi:hypothetical protein
MRVRERERAFFLNKKFPNFELKNFVSTNKQTKEKKKKKTHTHTHKMDEDGCCMCKNDFYLW